ncbi:cytochrome P450 family protein [Trifolium repens]|nr:cytochrome P450 family protein [Trifolium repens]
MLVSTTVLYLAFSRKIITPAIQIHGNHVSMDSNTINLCSCLYTEEMKRERKMNPKKNKKKVRFEEGVKETREKSEVICKEKQRKQNRVNSNCRNETQKNHGMPANRITLYKGILRERDYRMENRH